MAASIEVKYFNAILLKKVLSDTPGDYKPVYGGSMGIPQSIGGYPVPNLIDSDNNKEWVIEESRIQGGYNEVSLDFGVKAYVVDTDNKGAIRLNSLIYSGIYNSRTGVNNTNQFSISEDITKSLDPAYGSIQKLYAEDTNLIVFQESKVSRALIDKDAIYSAEGGGTITSSQSVIGTFVPYAGNYGISKDPLSFAVYGYRKYFTDRYRNCVLRLSQDGITEISMNGMSDFFRDAFEQVSSPQYGPGLVIGGWDSYNKQYIISLQSALGADEELYNTLNFDDSVNGFGSFFDYRPQRIVSVRNKMYTTNKGSLYLHNSDNVNSGNFYGQDNKSSVTLVLNQNPSLSKNFKTVNYEGDNGWQVESFVSDFQKRDFTTSFNNWESYQDTSVLVPSYLQGAYDLNGNTYPTMLTPPIYRYGFNRKENKYYANIVNNSIASNEEVIYGDKMSGIKGRFATVTVSTDSVTDPGGKKELWSVGSDFTMSSY